MGSSQILRFRRSDVSPKTVSFDRLRWLPFGRPIVEYKSSPPVQDIEQSNHMLFHRITRLGRGERARQKHDEIAPETRFRSGPWIRRPRWIPSRRPRVTLSSLASIDECNLKNNTRMAPLGPSIVANEVAEKQAKSESKRVSKKDGFGRLFGTLPGVRGNASYLPLRNITNTHD
jgi:hypothetical protein